MKILIAEDNKAIARGLEIFLKNQEHTVVLTENGEDALIRTLREKPDLVISDVKMPGKTGIEFLQDLREMNNLTPFIVVTAHATVENAIQAMKIGANDFLLKPLNLEELGLKIGKIKKDMELLEENRNLKTKLKEIQQPEIIGNSKAIKQVRQLVQKVKYDRDITVMIYGESGTGKELVAGLIHNSGTRAGQSFIPVNCAAIPDNLMESEFFGYRKGAFTGALTNKKGLFQVANGGTLFLDEVSEMSQSMQAKLLRVLQEKQVQSLGSTELENIDIQVIGASNRNLKELVGRGEFREDLFYRLSVLEIDVPALKNRKEDIPLLIEYFMNKISSSLNFTPEAIDFLQKYNWPGNIRELENLIRKMNVIYFGKIIGDAELKKEISTRVPSNDIIGADFEKTYKSAMEENVKSFECKYLHYHLHKNDFNISKTCEKIGVSRVTLHKKINEYNIKSIPER
ncbi:MAG: sigma-54-dependent Fis family transcriptional regulator [Candidatus Marinimicrobia bacterium]|nr:sigma-54-dependent Fis family transcriptional regulator [Candidatus Neomarinimicrobiota bacterium]